MSSERVPLFFIRVVSAVVKHQIKKQMGEEALGAIADAVEDQVEGEATGRVTSLFSDTRQVEAIAQAGRNADECFRQRCEDRQLQQIAEMPVARSYQTFRGR